MANIKVPFGLQGNGTVLSELTAWQYLGNNGQWHTFPIQEIDAGVACRPLGRVRVRGQYVFPVIDYDRALLAMDHIHSARGAHDLGVRQGWPCCSGFCAGNRYVADCRYGQHRYIK